MKFKGGVNSLTNLCFILLVSVFLSGCSASQGDQSSLINSPIKIGYLPVAQALPLFVAIEKGYFKEEGLDVEATPFESPNQFVDALLAGNLDAGIAAATGITAISQSKKPDTLKIFYFAGAEFPEHLDGLLLVQKESHMSSVSELRGKKVGTIAGSIQWRTITRKIMVAYGLGDEDYTLVEVALPLQTEALASGQIDALITLEPIGVVARSKGVARDLVVAPTLKHIADPFLPGAGVVTTAFVKSRPQDSQKVMYAIERAIDDIRNDPDSSRLLLKKFTPLTDEVAQKVPLPFMVKRSELNSSNLAAAQEFVDIFYEYKVLEKPVSVQSFVYS